MKHTVIIEGMSCNNCVKHVTNAISGLEGVSEVAVTLDPQVAVVEADESVSVEAIKKAVEETGYRVV